MRRWFDHFVKELLHEAFESLGTASREVEIQADAQRIDFYFVPSPVAPVVRDAPPIFVRMARAACLVEHYGHPPDLPAMYGCLRKQLTRHHLDGVASRQTGQERGGMPLLWVLSTGRPAEVLRGFGFRRLRGWPMGVYRGPLQVLPYRLIVLNELPATRFTLPLRLLARGTTFRCAMDELRYLPPDAWERRHLPRLLLRWRAEMRDAGPPQELITEEKELLVDVDEYLRQVEEKGIERGLQQGIERGLQQGIERGLQQGMQPLLHLCARKLGRTLSADERARFLGRLDTLGPDRLGDVVLDLGGAQLAAWLADPDAR